MRLVIVLKSQLLKDQMFHLERRLAEPAHANDRGPISGWHLYQMGLYAFIHQESNLPIAIASASGPTFAVVPAWWVDSKCRNQGYGSELVDLLAAQLKQEGYTGVGKIVIDTYRGDYLDASTKLAERFKAHFRIK